MNKERLAGALCDLGIAVEHLRDHPRALTLLNEGLELSRETGDLYLIAACLTGLASIEQKPQRAVLMLAASQTAFERSGEFIEPLYRVEQAHTETQARKTLGDARFEATFSEGQKMSLDEAVDLALKIVEEA
jgi:hypothetical protein